MTARRSVRSLILACLPTTVLALSCGDDASPPVRVNLGDTQALFTMDEGSSFKALKGKSSSETPLLELTSDGEIRPVPFIDAEGVSHYPEIMQMTQINDEYVGVQFFFAPTYTAYTVLVELATGELRDVSDFTLRDGQIRNNNIYLPGAWEGSCLYRIDMETWIAYPLNNPHYDPVMGNRIIDGDLGDPMYDNPIANRYLVTSDGWVHCLLGGPDEWALDPDAGFPVPSWMGSVLELGQGTRLALLFGDDDKFYNLELHDQGSGTLEVLVGVITDSYTSGPTLNTYTGGYGLSQYYVQADVCHSDVLHGNRLAILRDGYVTSSMDPGGAIMYQWTAKDMSFLGDTVFDNANPIYKRLYGSQLFWREGNTIKTADVLNDTTVTDLVTNDDMINAWTVGNTVMFTAYITFLEIGTYKVESDLTVSLVETSEMYVKEILEFTAP